MHEEILIVDDEEIITESLGRYLEGRGYSVRTAGSIAEARRVLGERAFDLVLLDMKLPDGTGTDLLKDMGTDGVRPLVIVMTAYATVDSAVTAMKTGAYDFIQKPFRTRDIELIVRLALETRKLDRDVRRLLEAQAEKHGITTIIALSQSMREIFGTIRKVARAGANSVLILGESGTGKELVARALHYESPRAIWPFVAVNCSAIPENLLESELYGHERGAFTDAKERKIGLFEQANKGTLLLDEIGDMNADLQTKLLRTLEDRTIRRIGGSETISLDIQLIASTNRDLARLVEEGRFRKDLYFRLKVITIAVPPLRERREDIMPLTQYFLNHFNSQTGRKFRGITDDAARLFSAYSYPGNVRELKNIIEKIVILEDGEYVGVEHLPEELVGARQRDDQAAAPDGVSLDDAVQKGLDEVVAGLERRLIAGALERCGGNKSEAAKLLRLDRSTLRYKIRQYGLGQD